MHTQSNMCLACMRRRQRTILMYLSGRIGCAIAPARAQHGHDLFPPASAATQRTLGRQAAAPLSSAYCAVRRRVTSSMRLTAREFMSAENSCKKRQRDHHTADDVAAVLKLKRRRSSAQAQGACTALQRRRARCRCRQAAFCRPHHGRACVGGQLRPHAWSRNTVRPSLSVSWNQSRQVTRLPVQLRAQRQPRHIHETATRCPHAPHVSRPDLGLGPFPSNC